MPPGSVTLFLSEAINASALQRVENRRFCEAHRALVIVAQAVARLVVLQGAADVVLAVNHRPAAVDLDAFQVGIDGAIAALGSAVGRFTTTTHLGNGRAVQVFAI